MRYIEVDGELADRLGEVSEQTKIIGANGELLGRFFPGNMYEDTLRTALKNKLGESEFAAKEKAHGCFSKEGLRRELGLD